MAARLGDDRAVRDRRRGRAQRSRRRRERVGDAGWYVVLTAIAFITVFPFAWMLLTSLKGPTDPITSVPPQFFPTDPTLANYVKVWDSLPIASFFLNSVVVAVAVGLLNVLVAALAAYPLAKMRFRGRDAIFYLLLATLIVPAQLTYIPSFVLAVNVFHYYDTLAALIFPQPRQRVQHLPAAPGVPGRAQRPARRGARRRRGRVADLVAGPAADRPAVARRGGDLHVRHVVERLPVAVADAPHPRGDDAAGRARRAAGRSSRPTSGRSPPA